MSELREYTKGIELFKSGIPALCCLCHRNVKSHSFIGFRKTVSGDYVCSICDDECDEYEATLQMDSPESTRGD